VQCYTLSALLFNKSALHHLLLEEPRREPTSSPFTVIFLLHVTRSPARDLIDRGRGCSGGSRGWEQRNL